MIDYRKLYSKYDKEDLINTCINLKEYKERLRKEVNKSYMICNEKDKEIERLNKDLETSIEICNNRQKEIVRLNNIINKGIEYILGNDLDNFNNINNLLNILKGSDE